MQPTNSAQPHSESKQPSAEQPAAPSLDQKKLAANPKAPESAPLMSVKAAPIPSAAPSEKASTSAPVAFSSLPAASNTSTAPPPALDLPAEEVDVIEKEWVDRAENIIKTTASDPFAEEQQEESLSKEYLKKRFNVDVDDS